MDANPTQIGFTPQQRDFLVSRASRLGVDESVVRQLIGDEPLCETTGPQNGAETASVGDGLLPPEEWIAAYHKMIDEFAVSVPNVDDSRDSIYGDR